MPKSKSKRNRYIPPPKKKKKPSPRWFGWLIIGVMALGVITIVTNYMGLIPGTNGTANQVYLFGGLGLIAFGFLLSTQWR
jgi:TRAP-type mannitol/chloroaromatic compound transport system permease small subunit